MTTQLATTATTKKLEIKALLATAETILVNHPNHQQLAAQYGCLQTYSSLYGIYSQLLIVGKLYTLADRKDLQYRANLIIFGLDILTFKDDVFKAFCHLIYDLISLALNV